MAFFTDNKAVNGDPFITATYQGATYIFASKEHKELFEATPEKYVPQCGGYCAFGMSLGALFPVDINTWKIRNGKLYLNLNKAILKNSTPTSTPMSPRRTKTGLPSSPNTASNFINGGGVRNYPTTASNLWGFRTLSSWRSSSVSGNLRR